MTVPLIGEIYLVVCKYAIYVRNYCFSFINFQNIDILYWTITTHQQRQCCSLKNSFPRFLFFRLK